MIVILGNVSDHAKQLYSEQKQVNWARSTVLELYRTRARDVSKRGVGSRPPPAYVDHCNAHMCITAQPQLSGQLSAERLKFQHRRAVTHRHYLNGKMYIVFGVCGRGDCGQCIKTRLVGMEQAATKRCTAR